MPVILTKAIKPKPLKVDALRLKLLSALHKCERDMVKDFKRTTSTWSHQPKWESAISLMQPGPTILVGTDDERYRWISEGTGKYGPTGQPYEIWAGYYTGKSDKKVLAFASAFTPKTSPGRLDAGPGSSGEVNVHVPYVVHPGIKPRKFEKQIADLWRKKFKERMEQAMREAAQASGHGI